MANSEFERAKRYGDLAMGLLSKGSIPPYPQFYELLYTYASGVNPALNARLNSLFSDPDAAGTNMTEKLYNEFLRTRDSEERLNTVSEEISERIDAVNTAISSAISSTHAYKGSLEQANGTLGKDVDKDTLKAIARRLLEETQSMQENNKALERQLEVSRSDINALQRDLDVVRKESMLDPLTKICNRKAFDQGLQRALEEAHKSDSALSLVLLDIDHFKKFNDTYGHQTGDQVLRLVAMSLKSSAKGDEMAARYGGEEFAVILPGTALKGARKLAESIRKAIHGKELLKRSTNQKLGRITASFGVAQLGAEDTTVSLIERADESLYAAKAAGRNCVIDETERKQVTAA